MCRIGRCALAQVLSAGILRSRRCLYGKFRLAIAIVVTHEHLRVVRPRTDVYAQIDAPKFFAAHLVTVNDDVARLPLLGIVLGIARIPLENQLELAISIHIAHGNIVGTVGVVATACRPVQVHCQELLAPHGYGIVRCKFLAVYDSLYGISARGCPFRVGIVARLCPTEARDFLAIAVQVKARLGALGPKDAPAEEHAPASLNRHKPAVQPFHLASRLRHAHSKRERKPKHPQLFHHPILFLNYRPPHHREPAPIIYLRHSK